MDSTLYNAQCRDCGAPMSDCKCHKESKMNDTRTLEQVILDASRGFYEPRGGHPVISAEAAVIADAVREWMKVVARESGHGPSGGVQGIQADRIKELEAEVERMRSGIDEWADKAAKYDALRERFPYLPGQVFYVQWKNKIQKKTVWAIFEAGVIDEERMSWHWHECHPTADACRAAIPVEE